MPEKERSSVLGQMFKKAGEELCVRSERWVQCGSGNSSWICFAALLVCSGNG